MERHINKRQVTGCGFMHILLFTLIHTSASNPSPSPTHVDCIRGDECIPLHPVDGEPSGCCSGRCQLIGTVSCGYRCIDSADESDDILSSHAIAACVSPAPTFVPTLSLAPTSAQCLRGGECMYPNTTCCSGKCHKSSSYCEFEYRCNSNDDDGGIVVESNDYCLANLRKSPGDDDNDDDDAAGEASSLLEQGAMCITIAMFCCIPFFIIRNRRKCSGSSSNGNGSRIHHVHPDDDDDDGDNEGGYSLMTEEEGDGNEVAFPFASSVPIVNGERIDHSVSSGGVVSMRHNDGLVAIVDDINVLIVHTEANDEVRHVSDDNFDMVRNTPTSHLYEQQPVDNENVSNENLPVAAVAVISN